MRGFTRALGICSAALLLVAHTWAGVVPGEPDANLIASFDGDNNLSASIGQTQWFTGWGSETPSTHFDTKLGKGFQVVSGSIHPWNAFAVSGTFSCAIYADISGATPNALLASFGQKDNHIALIKSAADTVQVWQGGALVTGLSITSSALSSGYHLLAFGNDSNGAFLNVDGATTVTTSTALTTPAEGFQLGAMYKGKGTTINWTQAGGMKVDELRGYNTKLTAAQLKALAEAWIPPLPTLAFAFTNNTTAKIGSINWSYNDGATTYVDSFRSEPDGTPSKAVTINNTCHPGTGYTWPAEFSVMSYIKVTDTPDTGTVASFGDGCFLVKRNSTTMRFGTERTYVDATDANLSKGWHLVVAKRSASGLSIQIDGGTAVTGSTAIDVGSGFQIGTRWTGEKSGTAIQATNLYVDELAIYHSALDDAQVKVLVETYPAVVPVSYTADLTESTESTIAYSALSWDVTGSVPGRYDEVIIKTPAAGITITLDGEMPPLNKFTVQGGGKLTLATSEAFAGKTFLTNETVANVDLDVSAITTALGTLSVATGKELTVGATTISDIDTAAKGALVVKGAALYDKGGKGEVGLTNDRVITVSGSGASLSLKGNDSTGWGYTAGQKVVLQDGGTLITKSRETMITPLELCGGHLQLTAAQSSRAIDFFNGTASVTDLTVTAKDGETGETLSTLTSTGSDEPAQTALIRQAPGNSNNTFSIDVDDKARLRVDTILASSATYDNGNGNQTETGTAPLEKKGDGVLELTRANTYATGTKIVAGTVLVSGKGSLGTGAVSVNTNATLELALTDDREMPNEISGGGTLVKRGTCDLLLTAASGELKVSIQEGLLGIGTLRPTTLTIAEGARVMVTPTEEEVAAGSLSLPAGVKMSTVQMLGYTITGVSEEGVVSFSETGEVTWTPTATNQNWDEVSLWNTTAVPTTGRLTINISELTAPATLAIPATSRFESTTFVGGTAETCALEVEVTSSFALGTVSAITTNVTLPLDVVNAQGTMTVTKGTLTVKNTEDGALTAAISGEGAFAKSGAGVLTLDAAVRTGKKTIVKEGTLKMGTEALTTIEDGGTLHDVDVLAGATLDVNGKSGLWLQTVTLYAGATYANSGNEIGNGQRQLVNLTLQGNATVSGANAFGLLASQFGSTTLTLNGYKLTKEGNGDFWLYNTTVTGGSISALAVSAGQFNVQGVVTLASDVTLSTTKSTGNALTKAGAVTLAAGTTLTVSGRGTMLGGDGLLTVSKTATLKFTSTGDTKEADVNYSTIIGNGTVLFEGSGFRTLPNGEDAMFASDLELCNKQASGLVITRNGSTSPVTTVGSVSGTNGFRADWEDSARTLRIVQSKNTTLSGPLMMTNSIGRLTKVLLAGAENATKKTLTLSGDTEANCLLEIENTGSVNLTGSWAGAMTVNGRLAGTGTVSGTLTFNRGASLDVTGGALTAQTVAFAENATVTVTGATAAGTEVLKCSNPAEVAAKLTGAPDGLFFAKKDAENVVVLVASTVDLGEGVSGELSTAAQAALAKVAADNRMTTATVTGSTTVEGVAKTLSAAQINNALTVFGDSVVTAEGTTLKVDYNFGIDSMEQTARGIVIKAKVQKRGGNSADFASGTAVKLVDADDNELATATTLAGGTATFAAIPAANLTGKLLKVKATK